MLFGAKRGKKIEKEILAGQIIKKLSEEKCSIREGSGQSGADIVMFHLVTLSAVQSAGLIGVLEKFIWKKHRESAKPS